MKCATVTIGDHQKRSYAIMNYRWCLHTNEYFMLVSSFLYLNNQRPPFLMISHRRKRAISSKLVEVRVSPRLIRVMEKPWRRAPERVSKMRHVGSVDWPKRTSDRGSWLIRRECWLLQPWRQRRFGKNGENIKKHQHRGLKLVYGAVWRMTFEIAHAHQAWETTVQWGNSDQETVGIEHEGTQREIESDTEHYPFWSNESEHHDWIDQILFFARREWHWLMTRIDLRSRLVLALVSYEP